MRPQGDEWSDVKSRLKVSSHFRCHFSFAVIVSYCCGNENFEEKGDREICAPVHPDRLNLRWGLKCDRLLFHFHFHCQTFLHERVRVCCCYFHEQFSGVYVAQNFLKKIQEKVKEKQRKMGTEWNSAGDGNTGKLLLKMDRRHHRLLRIALAPMFCTKQNAFVLSKTMTYKYFTLTLRTRTSIASYTLHILLLLQQRATKIFSASLIVPCIKGNEML